MFKLVLWNMGTFTAIKAARVINNVSADNYSAWFEWRSRAVQNWITAQKEIWVKIDCVHLEELMLLVVPKIQSCHIWFKTGQMGKIDSCHLEGNNVTSQCSSDSGAADIDWYCGFLRYTATAGRGFRSVHVICQKNTLAVACGGTFLLLPDSFQEKLHVRIRSSVRKYNWLNCI